MKTERERMTTRLANATEETLMFVSRRILPIFGRGRDNTAIFAHDPPRDEIGGDHPFADYVRAIEPTAELTGDHTAGWTLAFPDREGERRETTATVIGAYNPDRPTILFHHSHGLYNPKLLIALLFRGKELRGQYNIVSIRAAYHTNSKTFSAKSFDTLQHMEDTFAGSVLMVEKLQAALRSESKGAPVAMVGVSMGGMVTTWHSLLYGSVDAYFPIVAIADAPRVFAGPGYDGATDLRTLRQGTGRAKEMFATNDFPTTLADRVFPVLAGHDHVVLSEWQRNYWRALRGQALELPFGHFAALFGMQEIRQYMIEKLAVIRRRREI